MMELNEQEQLFVITMEECGELIQECSKILRHGMNDKTHPKLIDEIGDVCAMIQLLKEKKHVTQKEIDKRMKVKFRKLKKYSDIKCSSINIS
jgi:NTP pyrophosphatase (non-canonical NTP hydrolase)